jgi:hypothetical protein
MRTFSVFLMAVCFLSFPSFSQINFVNRNDLLTERDMHSAVPVAIADMNNDGLDDIVTLNEGKDLFIQYQTPDTSRPFVRYMASRVADIDAQNDISIADFNNDGYNDILAVGSYDRVKIFYALPHTYDFELVYLVVMPFFSQGASTGDFNGDGWMDAVILNDNGLNYSLMNDGAGNLSHEVFFDFVTIPVSDNSGNYGSVYTDFDMDGDSDFYIAKCRQGVNNPSDPRRINALFVNDGLNNYTQNAAQYGLASGSQTWTADFGDIDNDGDLDCFMTQHDVISELYENIDNDTFINVTLSAGLEIGGIPLQGMFRDFDNDGFQDILVSGDRVDYYRNNGDKTFTKVTPFGSVVFGTFGLGDFNNDGFTDVYASRVIPFNNPDLLREDILFLNDKNENHFIAFTLLNTLSSPAVGATASLYGSWGIQVREVRGGEQYGVSNSHQVIFGLGIETGFDSLVVRWPDGSKETYMDLAIDKHWKIGQGNCATDYPIMWDRLHALCDQDSLILHADLQGPLTWNTGVVADSIIVRDAGLYFGSYYDQDNCLVTIIPIEVIVDPDSIKPIINYTGDEILCHGEIALLTVSEGIAYQWSTGDEAQSIEVTETGEYFAFVEGYCKVQSSDTISIGFLVPDPPITTSDSFHTGESAILIAEGDSIVWYDQNGTTIIGTGDTLILDGLTETTNVLAQNLSLLQGQEYLVGPLQHQGSSKYNASFVNGGLVFEVSKPIILHEFTVYTDSAGTRIIEISDGADFFYSIEVLLQPGANLIVPAVHIPPGSYTISTNVDKNVEEFGSNSPWLWRSSEGILFPYKIEGVMSITTSTFGEDFYYYFYDWKIASDQRYCASDWVTATAIFDPGVGTIDPAQDLFQVNPNPTEDYLHVQLGKISNGLLEIISLSGELLYSFVLDKSDQALTVDLNSYPSGTYFVRVTQQEKVVTKRIVRL